MGARPGVALRAGELPGVLRFPGKKGSLPPAAGRMDENLHFTLILGNVIDTK